MPTPERLIRTPRAISLGSLGRVIAGAVVALAAAAAVAVEHGFEPPPLPAPPATAVQIALAWLALIVAEDLRWTTPTRARWRSRMGLVGEPALAASGLLALAGWHGPADLAAALVAVAMGVRLTGRLSRALPNPSVLFPASFLLLIAISTCLLRLPAATPADRPIGWIDAAFTATSAVCVTGLVVRDTAEGFTPFGQAIILASIQLGGMGVMIFGSTLALLFGARLTHRENMTLSTALSEYPAHRIARFAWFIVGTTLVLEAIGAVAIYAMLSGSGLAPGERAWHAVFHSISAFCNAGFDITGASMVPHREGAVPYLAIMPLIVMGGLGFVVLEEVWRLGRARLRGRRLPVSTHTRLVVVTTLALLVAGAGAILLAQAKVPGPDAGQRVLDAAFMSATARTAGFNTVPMSELAPGSRFALMALMFVGGSPGSTAGGIKTLALALLVLAVWSTLRGRDEVEVFGRALPDALIKKAATLAFGLAALVFAATLLLDLTERIAFEPLLFEVISAASTTGLSLGATTQLSPAGRCILIVVMFLGRVGLLAALATVLAGSRARGAYRLPRDSVSLG